MRIAATSLERHDVGPQLDVSLERAVEAQVFALAAVLRLAAVERQLAVLTGIQEEVVEQVAIGGRIGIELCRAAVAPAAIVVVGAAERGVGDQLFGRPADVGIAAIGRITTAVVVGRAAIGVATGQIGLARRPRVGVVVIVGAIKADASRELVLPTAVAVAQIGVARGLHTLLVRRFEE